MNKLAIPALLLGVVMVAGAFAFMPVQEASTVHTTVIDSVASVLVVASNNCEMLKGASTNDCNNYTVTIPSGSNGVLLSTLLVFDENPTPDVSDVDFSDLVINGATTTIDPSAGTVAVDATVNVSGLNWGIEGVGATITSVNTNTLPTTGTESSFIKLTIFMLVDGPTSGISALID